jgi:hypothetical protein
VAMGAALVFVSTHGYPSSSVALTNAIFSLLKAFFLRIFLSRFSIASLNF